MRIPKKLKIKNSKYTITCDATKFDSSKYYGLCYYAGRHKEIFLDHTLDRNTLEETFFHELLHAMFPRELKISRTREEQIVEKLAKTLYVTMRENRLLANEKPKKRNKNRKARE